MTESLLRVERTAPQIEARIGGALYVVVIVTAFLAEMYARGSVIVSGDAAATARNILACEQFYRIGGLADIINLICDVGVAVVLYDLLKPAGQSVSLYAALMRVVADTCLLAATIFHFAPLLFLHGAPYLASFTLPQLQALAYECLCVHDLGYDVALVFFGVHLLSVAYLILRSALLPRIMGGLLLLTGVCYLINSFVDLCAPEIRVPFWLLLPGLVSETVMAGWLLFRGVDENRWRMANAKMR